MTASPSAIGRLFARPTAALSVALIASLSLVVSTFAAGAAAAATLATRRGGPLDLMGATLIATELGVLSLLAVGIPVLAYWATVCWFVVPTEAVGAGSALARSLGAVPRLLLGALVVLVAAAGLAVLSLVLAPLWLLSPFLWIAVAVRRRRRGARSGWRSLERWAIAFTPGAPLVYWLLAWSQWVPRVAVQGAAPLTALRDSAADLRPRWGETARAVLPWVLVATAIIAAVQLLALLGELWGWPDAVVGSVALVSLPVFLLATAAPTAATAGTWLDRGGRPPNPRRRLGLRPRSIRLAALALAPLLAAGVVTLPPVSSAAAADGPPVELLYVTAEPLGHEYRFTAAIRVPTPSTHESAGVMLFMLDPDGPEYAVAEALTVPSNASEPWTIAVATWTRSAPAPGPHTITAQFLGGEHFGASEALSWQFTVEAPNQQVDISWDPPSTWILGDAPLVRAQVSARSGAAPTGYVSLHGQVAGADDIAHVGRYELVPGEGGVAAVDIDLGVLPAGTHNLALQYEGSVGFAEAWTTFQLATARDPASMLATTTRLTVAGESVSTVRPFGEQVALTAEVVSSDGVLLSDVDGTMTILENGDERVTIPVDDGVATVHVALDALGPQKFRARFTPADPDVLASDSEPVAVTVRRGVASTVDAPAVVNGASSFAVTISLAQSSGPDADAPVPSGEIELDLGGDVGTRTAPLVGGVAQFTVPADHLGTRTARWRYAGDDHYVPTAGRLDLTVHDTTTATTLEFARDGVTYGGTLELDAQVRATDSALVPSGRVRFELRSAHTDDTSPIVLGTRALSGGEAQLSVPVPAPGTHTLVAVYLPDLGHAASTSTPETLVVPVAATTIEVAPVATSYGTDVDVVARVRIRATDEVVTGQVTFRNAAGEVVPGGDGVQLDEHGVARLTIDGTLFRPGTVQVRAEYLGTAQWASSHTTAAVEIRRATPVVQWDARPAIGYGASPVTEIALSAGDAVPTDGTVVSLVATDSFGWVVRGRAVLEVGAGVVEWDELLWPEEWTVRASTEGDAEFEALDESFTTRVSAVATRIELGAPSATTVAYGAPFQLTALVHAVDWAEAPAGRVVFRHGGVELGAVELEPAGTGSSAARLEAPFLSELGARAIQVSFEPDSGRFGASQATGPVVAMTAASPEVTLTVTPAKLGERAAVEARVSLPGLDAPLARGTIRFFSSGANGSTSYTAGIVNGRAALPDGILITTAGELTIGAEFRSLDDRWRDVDDGDPAATAATTLAIAKGEAVVSVAAPARLEYGETLAVQVEVGGGPVTPRGSVQLVDAETEQALGDAVPLTQGSATIELDAEALSERLGERRYLVQYSGDANLAAASSAAFVVRVDPAATTVTAWATGRAVDGIFVHESGEYVASVRTAAGGVPPGTAPAGSAPLGQVSWLRSGELVGSAPVDATGTARLSVTPVAVWEGVLEVVFTPSDPGWLTPSSTLFGAVWREAPVTLSVAPQFSASIGAPVRVEATLFEAYTGPGLGPESAISGQVEFLASTGESCVAEVRARDLRSATAACELDVSSPGTRQLDVRYTGGGPYTPASAAAVLQVARGVPVLEVSVRPDEEWVEFATATIEWRVVGPTVSPGEAVVIIRRGGDELCRSAELVGSCDYVVEGRDPQATLSLHFAGDDRWAPASTQLTRPVIPCLAPPLVGVAEPELGRITLTTPLDCGRAGEPPSGVRRGTVLEYRIDARPGFEAVRFSGALRGSPGDTTASLTLLHGVAEWGQVSFGPACVPLELTNAVVLSGTCTTRAGGVGLRHGSLAEFEARPPSGSGAVQFAGWSASLAGMDPRAPRQHATMIATGDRFVIAARYTPACYPVTAEAGNGVAFELAGTECTIFATGAPGYRIGSALLITSTGDFGFAPLPPAVTLSTGEAVATAPVSSRPTSRVDRVEIVAPLTVSPASTRCVPLRVVTEGAAYGSITLHDPGNCVLGDGWYLPGSRVPYSTSRVDDRMSGYEIEGSLALSRGEPSGGEATRYIDVGRDGGTLIARFASENCVSLDVEVKPAGAAQYRVDADREPNGCPPGQFDASGEGVTFTIDAVTLPAFTDAMVGITGWAGTSTGGGVPETEQWLGSPDPSSRLVVTKSTPGAVELTVWVCQRLDVSTRVVNPWGVVVTEGPASSARELVAVSMSADCPLAGGSYQLGDEVLLMNAADPRGFTFDAWTGASAGTDAVQRVVMDGVSPKRLVAEYTATCYRLTTRLDEATIGTDERCPGRDDLWFAGGSYVPLAASGTSGTFEGWFAPDPRDLYAQEGVYALVEMTEDREVYASYRGDRWYDGAVDFFEDVGDVLAMFAKQALGAAAQGFKYVAQEIPPFSYAKKAVMGIGLVGEGIASLLEYAGVDAGWFDEVRSVLGGIDEVWTLAWSPLDCLTVWSVDGNGGAAAAQQSWAAQMVSQVDLARKAQQAAQVAASGKIDGSRDLLKLAGAAYALYGQTDGEAFRTLAQRVLASGATSVAAVIAVMDQVGVYYETPEQAAEIASGILDGISSGAITSSLAAPNVVALAELAQQQVEATKEYRAVKMLVDVANGDASWAEAASLMGLYLDRGAELAGLERAYGVGAAFVSAMANADWTQPASQTFSTEVFADSFSSCMGESMPGFFGIPS